MATTTTTTTANDATLSLPPLSSTSSSVYGKLRYIPEGHIPAASPHNFHLPPISEFSDVRLLPLHDMRPLPTAAQLASSPSGTISGSTTARLSTHGFTALHHPTTLNSPPYSSTASFKDPSLLKAFYIPETEAMLRQITGARTVITETLILRSALWTESDALAKHAGHGEQDSETNSTPDLHQAVEKEKAAKALTDLETGFPQFIGFSPTQGGASPAPKIHLDYAPAGARTHIRLYHPVLQSAARDIISAEENDKQFDYSGPRWALFSIWRPLKRVRRDPLALGDRRTFLDEDYVPVAVKTPTLGLPDGVEAQTHFADSYLARYSAGQQWCWVSDQQPEEVLVIGLFDSEKERNDPVAAGGTLHSSVEIEGTENEEARESVELRCIAIW